MDRFVYPFHRYKGAVLTDCAFVMYPPANCSGDLQVPSGLWQGIPANQQIAGAPHPWMIEPPLVKSCTLHCRSMQVAHLALTTSAFTRVEPTRHGSSLVHSILTVMCYRHGTYALLPAST